MSLGMSDRAAARIQELLSFEKKGPEVGLRVGVIDGGCSGPQYFMEFDTARKNDHVVQKGGVQVIVDPESAPLLDGAELDYGEERGAAGFALRRAHRGESFEV